MTILLLLEKHVALCTIREEKKLYCCVGNDRCTEIVQENPIECIKKESPKVGPVRCQ